jgi:hypothetical protein
VGNVGEDKICGVLPRSAGYRMVGLGA